MSDLADKTKQLIESERIEFTDVFAVPGERSIIDTVHPNTGRSTIFGQTLDEIRQRYPAAVIMPWETWRQEQITRQNTPITWHRITERKYAEMLDVLPPICFTASGFMVSEPVDHSHETGQPRFDAFIIRHGQHLASSRPMTVAEYKAFKLDSLSAVVRGRNIW